METYKIVFTPRGKKDLKIIINSEYKEKAFDLLEYISKRPYGKPPEYKVLKGDMEGVVSRRISRQHRLVYQVFDEDKIIKILMMWTHYHK
ncbi:MAG: Txe/YoeB family addiction module toxin [Firmicutes bacterium HGW-Firmicutes-1]|nr:MAG: Txe/YoeB family addiction module toxin [Firmicutes bacterium HGW-Firmicutes-1]